MWTESLLVVNNEAVNSHPSWIALITLNTDWRKRDQLVSMETMKAISFPLLAKVPIKGRAVNSHLSWMTLITLNTDRRKRDQLVSMGTMKAISFPPLAKVPIKGQKEENP